MLRKVIISCFIIFIVLLKGCYIYGDNSKWEKLEEGLYLQNFDIPKAIYLGGAAKVTVLKINPQYFSFRLLTSSELNEQPLTAKQWAKKYKLVATVNAGMYQEDKKTNVGFMKNYKHVNNPRIAKNYKAVFAFNHLSDDVPDTQIIDLDCQDFATLKHKYKTFVQNLRLINCKGENVWKKQANAWSMAALATDNQGNVLIIFTATAFTVYDFINVLLELPLSIKNAMYLEGGKETSLYVDNGAREIELSGNGASFYIQTEPWPIPNVIGIVRKTNIK
ncbi:MAG: phosphodiester glycosidase family protein [Candidatus Magnetoovum sp. WYHC-5]|nr:phosphodiester glycosidase family protein [Candidatus Magnetoovum sp. WYHC-5]